MNLHSTFARGLQLAACFCASGLAILTAQPADAEIAALREQIRLLDQRLQELERQRATSRETASTPTAPASKVAVNDRSVALSSADEAHAFRLKALVQADSRWFFNDGGIPNNDAFILRRARMIFEGTFHRWLQFQIVPEFGGGSTTLLDANVTLALRPELQVKVGKFKSPVGLEQLQSDSWAYFIERSMVSGLVPNRDIGVQVGGDVLEGKLNYSLAVLNGVADGSSSSNNADFDDDKDFVVRLFAQPFKGQEEHLLSGLGIGFAASYAPGSETASALTSGYRTDGQQRFFTYTDGTVADGDTWRLAPQAYLYSGPFGMMAEYVRSTVNVRAGTNRAELQHVGWQASAGYVLTGEDASYGGVKPDRNFSPGGDGWGAFEVVARISQVDIDEKTFPLFASPAVSADKITSAGVGLNWYLNRSVRATVNYFHATFDTALAPTSLLLQEGEDALLTRLQLTF